VAPGNRRAGRHPDRMIKYIGALLGNTQDTMHGVAIYSCPWEFIKHSCCNMTYISDEQLHTMELCICRGIKVQLEGSEDEHISQMCLWTGKQSWCRVDRSTDCVCAMQPLGMSHWVPNGRLSWHQQPPSEIKLINKDGAFVEYWSALALTTIP